VRKITPRRKISIKSGISGSTGVDIRASHGMGTNCNGSFGSSFNLIPPNKAMQKGENVYAVPPINGGPWVILGAD